MYVRMVIGEAISDDHVRELVKIANEDLMIAGHNGFQGSQTLQEEGGRMVVILTSWTTREECIAYHCSRAYRQFVAKTHHLLIGDFVVKLFRME